MAVVVPDSIRHPKTRALWNTVRRPECQRCVLHQGAQTVCLLGDGPTPAKMMAIGEAPGEREDEEAFKPFAGRAGKLLDQVLAENNIKRSEFYITNVVKCRPPNNRKPKKDEVVACNVFLRAEIRIQQPEVVLLLGETAINAVLGLKGVMVNRQRVIERDGIKYFCALHPSAGLRPIYKAQFQDDIRAFAKLIGRRKAKTNVPAPKIHLVNDDLSFDRFIQKLHGAQRVAFDIETEGNVTPATGKPGTITLFGASFEPGEAYVVVLDHAEGWDPKGWAKRAKEIARALFRKGKEIIAHNGKYDVRWFLPYKPNAEYTFDTMFAAFLLDENRSMSLENLSMQELEVRPWKADVEYRRDFPLKKYSIYNGFDVDYTMRLADMYEEELNRQSRLMKVFRHIMMPNANIFARIEQRGIYIEPRRLAQRIEEAKDKEQAILADLMEYVPPELRTVTDKRGRRPRPFNPASPQQMARLLYSEEGLNLPFPVEAKKTKTGALSTAEGALKLLDHPIADVIEQWRYVKAKVLATYFLRWKTMRDSRDYVHFIYNLIGAVTGRTSSDLHQTPRDPFVRGVLSVEDHDEWEFGSADFSQAEMRIAAHLSGDKTLIAIFNDNSRDVHTHTAMKITGLPLEKITSELRKRAKAVNFGFLYRMFQKKFRDYAREKFDVKLTMSEATEYRRSYFDEYDGLEPWHNKQIRECQMNGQVRYLDGRLRRLPDIWSEDEASRSEAERQAINSPVQGFVSDMALWSMAIGEYGGWGFEPIVDDDFQWMGQMHDEVIFKVRKRARNRKCRQLKNLMENLPFDQAFGFTLKVPIVAEVKLGQYWGETKEWAA